MNCSSCGREMEESTRYDRIVDDLLSQVPWPVNGFAAKLREQFEEQYVVCACKSCGLVQIFERRRDR